VTIDYSNGLWQMPFNLTLEGRAFFSGNLSRFITVLSLKLHPTHPTKKCLAEIRKVD
jgi:hypothetical protein